MVNTPPSGCFGTDSLCESETQLALRSSCYFRVRVQGSDVETSSVHCNRSLQNLRKTPEVSEDGHMRQPAAFGESQNLCDVAVFLNFLAYLIAITFLFCIYALMCLLCILYY